MNCKYCNKRLRKGSKFCTECGRSVDEVETPIIEETPSKGLAIASIIIGSVSLFLGLFMLVIVPGVGLTLGLVQKGKCTERTVGIALNSVAIGLGLVMWLVFGVFFVSFFGTVFGEGSFFDRIDRIGDRIERSVPYGSEYSTQWNNYNYKIEEPVFGDSIIGEWITLEESDEICSFDKEEFYCYTKDDKENNYVYGKYRELSLSDGAISQSKLRETYNRLDVKNIQFISLTPLREVIDGVEQDSSDNEEYGVLWIIVNHKEGQEAQILLFDKDEEEDHFSDYGYYEYYARIK